jgi:hypothetical protein
LNEGGAGFMTDAVACNTIVLDLEETLKDFRVIKSEAEGKGTFWPGCGIPGNDGTSRIVSMDGGKGREERTFHMY